MTLTPEEKQELIALATLRSIHQARQSLMGFIHHTMPRYDENWHHTLIASRLSQLLEQRGQRLMIFVPPQYGKALAVDTPILTTDGWRQINDLQVGDFVFDPDGRPTEVIAKSEVFEGRRCYRVMGDDGAFVIADEAHLWTVRLCRKHQHWSVHSTEWLAARSSKRKAMIPEYAQIQYLPKSLSIDPYVLGYWLGDGTSAFSAITVGVDDKQSLIDNLINAGYSYKTSKRNELYVWVVGLNCQLKAANLIKNKHIPDEYMRASPSQRLRLLQGLIDSDGYVSRVGQCEFCSINETLAAQVLELVRSLGCKASFIEGRATINGRDCGKKYRVMFSMSNAASLHRKASRLRDRIKCAARYLTFEDAGLHDTVCIQVARHDGLFLAGKGFLVTHNSEIVSRKFPAWWLGHRPDARFFLGSYSGDLADSFNRDCQRLMESDDYHLVFPGTNIPSPGNDSSPRSSGLKGTKMYRRRDDYVEMVGHTGYLKSVGVGGSATGHGGDVFVIDDPFKSMMEATSEAVCTRVWQWWASVVIPRLSLDAHVIVMHTRWSDNDLAGRLLDAAQRNPKATQWEVIALPTLAYEFGDPLRHPNDPREPGQALWPETKGDREAQEVKRTDMGPRNFAAIEQQKPAPDGGTIFKREWFQVFMRDEIDLGAADEIIQSWDLRFSKNPDDNDFVVGTVWARYGTRKYLLDLVRGRWGMVQTMVEFKAMCDRWPQAYCRLVENKANGPALEDLLGDTVDGIVLWEPKGSKTQRAYACEPTIAAGHVYLPADAMWFDDYVYEMTHFPNTKHDDQVDSTSMAILHFLDHEHSLDDPWTL